MKTSTLICVVLGLVLGTLAQDETIDEKWDDVAVDKILANDALITSYVRCFLDLEPCTPDGLEAKARIRDALETGCAKCTESQKQNIERIIRYFVEKRQQLWNDIRAKYDPSGVLSVRFVKLG